MYIFIRKLIASQTALSNQFDRLLPNDYRIDGNSDFFRNMLGLYLKDSQKIYDVGGGKTPAIDSSTKQQKNSYLVGIDIDSDELAQAPSGLYDQTVCQAIENYHGIGDADLVICRSVLEHVKTNQLAFKSIARMLKPGGEIILFVPNRHAMFARLNVLLPEPLKRRLLFSIFPQTEEEQGFPAYYDLCTPLNFERLAAENGLVVTEIRRYYKSSYFSFFFPLYLVWRLWVIASRKLSKGEMTETFAMALTKPATATPYSAGAPPTEIAIQPNRRHRTEEGSATPA